MISDILPPNTSENSDLKVTVFTSETLSKLELFQQKHQEIRRVKHLNSPVLLHLVLAGFLLMSMTVVIIPSLIQLSIQNATHSENVSLAIIYMFRKTWQTIEPQMATQLPTCCELTLHLCRLASENDCWNRWNISCYILGYTNATGACQIQRKTTPCGTK